MENLVILTIKSTHFYLVDCAGGRLLIDAGWPGSLPAFKSQLKAHSIAPAEIRFVMMSHHHPDHAGLIQEVKRLSGARLLIHEKQVACLPDLQAFFERKSEYPYDPIRVEKNDLVFGDDNRARLNSIGVRGEIVETPGHSADSVTLVLDNGQAFTGDLPLPDMAVDYETTLASWKKLLDLNARTFYPSHADPISLAAVKSHLPT